MGPDSVHLLHGVGGLRQAAEVLRGVYVSGWLRVFTCWLFVCGRQQ